MQIKRWLDKLEQTSFAKRQPFGEISVVNELAVETASQTGQQAITSLQVLIYWDPFH